MTILRLIILCGCSFMLGFSVAFIIIAGKMRELRIDNCMLRKRLKNLIELNIKNFKKKI